MPISHSTNTNAIAVNKRSDIYCHALIVRILAQSIATKWHDAKREWELTRIFLSSSTRPGKCLCGHAPIYEHCVLANRENGEEVVVGNVCVNKFLEIETEKLFAAFRKVIQNPHATLSTKAVEYAYEHGWLNTWERDFYLDTQRKRKLSQKQMAKRVNINTQIIKEVTNNA